MNKRNTPTRLAALFAAAALLWTAAPPAPAQRRQRTPARPQRTTPAQSTTPAQRTPSAPSAEARPAEPRRAEPEHPVEELLPAGGFGFYAELRRLGQIFDVGEVKVALAGLRLMGSDAEELVAVADFVQTHAEVLADARLFVAGLPARPGLPRGIAALELPTPEDAARLEQPFRAILVDGAKSLGVTPAAAPPPRAPRGRGATRRAARPKPAPAGVVVKRAGRWLLAADKEFTPARLRREGEASLAEDVRFLSFRTRFSSEQLFVYFDTERSQQGWMLMMREEQEARERAQEAAPTTSTDTEVVMKPSAEVPGETTPPDAAVVIGTTTEPRPAPEAVGIPTGPAEESRGDARAAEAQAAEGEVVEPTVGSEISVVAPVAPPPPSEEQLAAGQMSRLMRNLWGGIPRWPGAAAAAIGLEGGHVAIRVAVENTPGAPRSLLPFLPNLVSGAPVTNDAAEVAPADGEIFVSGSLDWAQIFDSVMGTAKESPARMQPVSAGPRGDVLAEGGEFEEEGETPPSPEERLAQIEKVFGFKIREDLLPALGSEVAISLPLDEYVRSFRLNPKPGEGEKDAAPGFVALVALNDTDKVRRLLPRVLALFGIAQVGAAPAVETREGFEIHNAGGFSYAFINNHLVAGRLEQVRHAVDSFAARRTLASTNGYRDAIAWQARQKLLQGYVSDGLMRHTIEESKRQASGSEDPFVLGLLSQLEVPPEPAAFASTDEGDAVVHELRLPLNLIRVFGTGSVIGVKEAPVIGNEMAAAYALSSLRSAQEIYRGKEGRERFGTLEELIAEDLLEKEYVERLEYKFELNASGDSFEATATPKNYGKTGRRSFFVDQTGVIRAADHKGKAGSAQDPPID